jgi:hypothetical protein
MQAWSWGGVGGDAGQSPHHSIQPDTSASGFSMMVFYQVYLMIFFFLEHFNAKNKNPLKVTVHKDQIQFHTQQTVHMPAAVVSTEDNLPASRKLFSSG